MALASMSTGQAPCPRMGTAKLSKICHPSIQAMAPRISSHLSAGFSGREESRRSPVCHAYGPKVASLEAQEKMVSYWSSCIILSTCINVIERMSDL